jgi:malonyl-CoA/methylmalonyl-CoA synthetase
LPEVLESAVIGVPQADLGEGVLAVIVLRDPAQGSDPSQLAQRLAGRLARYKQPRQIVVVESMPKNAMGKIQKNALRDQFGAAFAGK